MLKGAGTVISMDATIDFLKRHCHDDRPMFTVTWFPSPHDPQEEIPDGLVNAGKLYNDEKTNKPGYFREITLLDQQVGRLQVALRDLGIEKNTLFIYCSDNGGLVRESSGGREKKGSIYEGGLRVPAIFQWPARYQGRIIETPVFTSDLYPTLVAIAGAKVSPQPQLDGIDLTPILDGTSPTHPPMGFWHGFQKGESTWSDRIIKSLMEAEQSGKPNPFPGRRLKNVNEYPDLDENDLHGHAAWNSWPWKLHRIEQNGKVKIELYHLIDDPMEKNDLSSREPERTAKMLLSLETWQRSVLRSWSGRDY